ncbi:uncharacterized protein SKDI_07G4130 [Saccharomyces kudriavzevii IFO 1802]|uniref:Uncharacterized protein n=1 Tax=Saccharomyces kudriavzevii (strain ATCC MYA-4449 / AS 2.2408 / CBS 8840 / NBRC 1802 / NCYC 2889) TaxID=226230 RepID=A0AA35JIR3_SACK1|nr:uncharacterized protein SKDI_07G4130 [Saccharomyces kudriavzevii IFO 1802]CAI4062639.1 hypothetical protein SKDI_07G4130 [Saccharomyces kudriavzevii IFO 1802]
MKRSVFLDIFSLLIIQIFSIVVNGDSCDAETNERDLVDFNFATPNITDHLGPTTISSLKLVSFFDCLRNNTNLTSIVGYLPGVASIDVHVSMEELGQYYETLYQKCCTINEYGLGQFDYLAFTQGRQDIFDSMDLADSDHRVVRSNIVGNIGTALGSANGDLIRDNTSEITQTLQKRSTNMVISFDTSSCQDGLTCNAFMGESVNRCISYHR